MSNQAFVIFIHFVHLCIQLSWFYRPLPHVRYRPNWKPPGRPVYARDLLLFPVEQDSCRLGMLVCVFPVKQDSCQLGMPVCVFAVKQDSCQLGMPVCVFTVKQDSCQLGMPVCVCVCQTGQLSTRYTSMCVCC